MRFRLLSSLLATGLSLLAGISVSHAATLTVTNTNDSGEGSLRQALTDANNETAFPGADVIQFAPEVRGSISLLTGLPGLNSAITIQGPGASALTVKRGAVDESLSFPLFNVYNGTQPVTVAGLTIAGGKSHTAGGVWGNANNPSILVKDCVVRGNTAVAGGGGGVAYVARVVNTLFQDNVALTTGRGNGGGYLGTGTLINCTFEGNRAELSGGGVASTGAVSLVNCTFSLNQAPRGGAADLGPGATVSHSTFSYNSSAAGTLLSASGLSSGTGSSAPATVNNSLFLDSFSDGAPNFATFNGGSFVSGGHNIFAQSTAPFALQTSDRLSTDPQFASTAPQNNGGGVPTIALAATSPAIDGSDSQLHYDARGFARPGGGTNDIGAFEFGSSDQIDEANFGPDFIVNEAGDAGDGVCGADSCTLREAVDAANAVPDASRITFAANVRGNLTLSRGQLVLSTPITIVGPGAQDLALVGSGTSRHFTVNSGISVSLSGLTLRDGVAPDNGNSASADDRSGGSIYNLGTLLVTDCVFDNNRAVGLTLSSSAFPGTIGNFGRGGAIVNAGALTMRGCTLSNNQAIGSLGSVNGTGGTGTGGAILSGSTATHTLVLENCTFSGNVAQGSAGSNASNSGFSRGGAITVSSGKGTLRFVTIANNVSRSGGSTDFATGGGLLVNTLGGATATAESCLLVNNSRRNADATTAIGSDVAGTLAGSYNLIGQVNDANLTGSFNRVNVGDAKLGALELNSGTTPTLALQSGSPAVNAGNPTIKTGTDQRGVGRSIGGRADVGAYELQFTPVESLVVNTLADEDDGTSDSSLGAGTSLREAIGYANSNTDANTIAFDPAVFNGPKTIALSLAQLSVTNSLTLNSPDAGTLTLTRSTAAGTPEFRILNLGGTSKPSVTLNGLVISGGIGYGGASVVNSGSLTMTNCVLTGSNSSSDGGGFYNSGVAFVRFCTFSNNKASTSGGGISNYGGSLSLFGCTLSNNSARFNGGGLYNTGNGIVTLSNCTVANNNAENYGGGVANDNYGSGVVTLKNSTVVGNNAGLAGGLYAPEPSGFYFPPAPSTVLGNTLVALNKAGGTTNVSQSDASGRFTSQNYNFIGNADGAVGFSQGNDQKGTTNTPLDPKLELSAGKPALKENGGPTQTVALLPLSPAVNTGDPTYDTTGEPTDQRGEGFARVKFGVVDIGAYEVQEFPDPTLVVMFTPGNPKTNDVLTAKTAVTGLDGATLRTTYQWKKNGEVLAGQTATTLDLSKAGNGDKGDQISLVATVSGDFQGTLTSESQPVTVQNSAPSMGTVAINQRAPGTDATLTLSVPTPTDPDGDAVTLFYAWRKNGATLYGETDPTLDLSKPDNGDEGDFVGALVTASDGTAQTTVESNIVKVGGLTPVLTSVSLAPVSPRTNDLLVAQPLPLSDAVTYSYVWRKNDVVLEGETESQLDLSKVGNGDRGDKITVTLVASSGTAESDSVTSNAVTVVNSAPSIADVTISPIKPGTDSTLTASVGRLVDVDGDDPIALSYQWRKNGQNIAGATGKTLDLSKAGSGDIGDRISVLVTASDGTGGTSAESPQVTVVSFAPIVSRVALSPTAPKTDDPITAVATASASAAPIKSYTFTWTRTRNGKAATIRTQTSAQNRDTLPTAGSAVVAGDLITVAVTASDGTYTSLPKTASVTVVNTPVSIARLTLAPTSPKTDSVLVANVQLLDADGGRSTNTYVWTKNSGGKTVTVFTETTTGSQSRLDLSLAGKGNKGDILTVIVTANDGSSKATKSASVKVGNTVPTLANLKLSPASPTLASKVTATFTATDPDVKDGLDFFKYFYTWKAAGRSLNVQSPTVDLSKYKFLKAGDTLSLELRIGDGTAISSTLKAAVKIGATTTKDAPSAGNS